MLLKYFFIMFMCEILELKICFCINLYFFFIIGDCCYLYGKEFMNRNCILCSINLNIEQE